MANVVIFTGATWTASRKANEMYRPGISAGRPLGAYQVAGVLRNQGYTVQVIDHWFELIKQPDLFVKAFKKYVTKDTLWVGWSNTFFSLGKFNKKGLIDAGYENEIQKSLGLSSRAINFINTHINATNPKIKLVCGGAKSFYWSKQDYKFFDYFVLGYADKTALDLTNFLAKKQDSLQTIKNINGSESIIYDQKGNLFDFNHHTHIWHECDHLHQGMALPIEISRGCIFKCSYCSFPLNGKKKNDFIRDSSKLIDELTYNYEKFGVTYYMYSDDTHNDSVDKLEYLYNNVYCKLPFKISFSTYLRLDLLSAHPHTIELLRESGLVGTFFGIESFNQKANKVIGKSASSERIMENLYKCKDIWKDKVIINAGLIVGLPNDSIETCTEWLTYSLSKDSPIDFAAIASLQLHPRGSDTDPYFQSAMEIDYKKYGYSFENGVWVNNQGMSRVEADKIKEKFDQYQLDQKGILKNWFDPHKAASLGFTLDEFYATPIQELVDKEEAVVRKYLHDTI